MTVTCTQVQRTLHAAIAGELDQHHARQVMEELDSQIDIVLPKQLILDLGGLTFTDSSGIAVLIRAFRHMEQLQGGLSVKNVPPQAGKVFQAAGLGRLIHFEG